MKKNIIITIIIVILVILCFVPFKSIQKDGGTVVYSAFFYKVIVWHRAYINEQSEPDFITGTDFYIFPFNFGEKSSE
ncbi:MAG TPA: hypothetical protein PK675_03715 [Clostridia bacterium]|nr:hypothetical protein [Clostridia bacterium]